MKYFKLQMGREEEKTPGNGKVRGTGPPVLSKVDTIKRKHLLYNVFLITSKRIHIKEN